MGFLGSFLGSDGARAAKGAADIQVENTDKGIRQVRKFTTQGRLDLRPFKNAGRDSLEGLVDLVKNPESQRAFIDENPFFNALAEKGEQNILNNAAARGKVGSGGTAEALINSRLLLGNDLLSQNISQRQGIANLGLGAASGSAALSQNAGFNIADLLTQRGNASAAGIVGAANSRAQGVQNVITVAKEAAKAIAASDIRVKENIIRVGSTEGGLPVYRFNYIGSDAVQMGVIAQDVEKVNPDAVIEIDGVKHVDYGAIH